MRESSNHGRDRPRERGMGSYWTTYPYVQLFLKQLPEGTTTLEIYNNFKNHGSISKIMIFDRRQDDRATRGYLVFEPPPRYPIWERGRFTFTTKTGFTKSISLQLSDYQPGSFEKESPVDRNRKYPDRTILLGSSLTWGVLAEPEVMMAMAATKVDGENVQFVLNLGRREITLIFPYIFHSDNRVSVRTFRFNVALDDNFTIWRLPEGRYVLHLSNVPWYSKQLREAIAQSHSDEAKYWNEEDTWARQTDIFDHKSKFELINKSPVSLQKNLSSINIARWTTFQVSLLDTEENMIADRTFGDALRDFNVNICDGQNFKVIEGPQEADPRVWTLLNGKPRSAEPLSLAEELSEFRLPFPVRYRLEVCLSHGWLSEYQITPEFLQTLAQTDEAEAKQILIFVASYQQRVWNPMSIFQDIRYRRPVRIRPLPEHCIEVCSATVTATSIIWNTPTVEITNRVIRRHRLQADRFLRVRFEDDTYRGKNRLYATPNNKMILIFQRVRRVLQHGIKLGDRRYDFLAWGNSQLREHGAYFFARGSDMTAANIRAEMGAFDQEKVVAKRAARMGQCFSTTRAVKLHLPAITLQTTIPDIRHGKYIFSDGVGKISVLAAQIVHQTLKIKGPVPSVFQFRLGGCKGVLTVWDNLPNVMVQVRESQFKFNSTSGDLEIIRWSELWQPFLNRQIIICLSNLGVPDRVFLKKQEDTIKSINAAMEDDKAAMRALRDSIDPNLMTLSLVDLVEAGFRSSKEPFVTSILHLWKAWSLKYLKEKAKIPVPKGAFVLGCVDESVTLRGHSNPKTSDFDQLSMEERVESLPEIFLQITDPHTNERKVIEGVCVLARNPSLHRGDIRVVRAVTSRRLNHLCDTVVMPAQGDRDLPSMCSGGDLDGDDYMVFWDPDLVPAIWNAKPFDYNAPPPKTAVGEIRTKDIINFFYDYLQNDYLGRIAHAHLAAADFLDEGIQSQTCIELVNLHSMAVDYPKTGVPAVMERRLERMAWPHYMEKKRSSSYTSHKILGQLYDAVKRVSFNPIRDMPFDERILNCESPPEEVARAVEHMKHDYDSALQRIMAQHNIKTEFEVWSTFVLDHSKASRDFKFHEEIGQLSSALKEQYYEAFVELAGGKDFQHLAPVAVAAYQYTSAVVEAARKEADRSSHLVGPDTWPFISFPWVLKDTLCKIARNHNVSRPVTSGQSSKVTGEVSEPIARKEAFASTNKKDTESPEASPILQLSYASPSLSDGSIKNVESDDQACTSRSSTAEECADDPHNKELFHEGTAAQTETALTSIALEEIDLLDFEPLEISGPENKEQASSKILEGRDKDAAQSVNNFDNSDLILNDPQKRSEDKAIMKETQSSDHETRNLPWKPQENNPAYTDSSLDPLYMTPDQFMQLGLPPDMEL